MIIQSMQKNGLILAAFALATTGAVALINDITKDKIANQEQQHLMQLLSQVIDKDQYDNTLYLDCTTSNAPELGRKGRIQFIALDLMVRLQRCWYDISRQEAIVVISIF